MYTVYTVYAAIQCIQCIQRIQCISKSRRRYSFVCCQCLATSVQRLPTFHFRFSNMAHAFIAMAQLVEQPPVDAHVHPEPPYKEDDPIKDGMKCYYAGCIGGRQLSATVRHHLPPRSSLLRLPSSLAPPIFQSPSSGFSLIFFNSPSSFILGPLASLTQVSSLIHCSSSVCLFLVHPSVLLFPTSCITSPHLQVFAFRFLVSSVPLAPFLGRLLVHWPLVGKDACAHAFKA